MNVGEFTLRPHQERAIAQARSEVARLIRDGLPPRVLIVAPCGAGKTVISSALIGGALLKDRRAVFMASGRQLIYQKSRTLMKAGIDHAVLMSGEGDGGNDNVLVASKDTYASRVEARRLNREERHLWIVDEAHRAMGLEWMKALPQDDKTVVIGFTATPALANGKGLGGYYKAIVVAATYDELLSAQLLVPCRVFAPWAVDTTGVSKGADGDWSWKQVEGRAKKLVGKVVETWKEIGEDRPTAVFAQGVEHSVGLTREFNAAGIPAVHIDAETPQADREAAFKALRDGRTKVACNFGVLTVGWDEPCVSCAVLAYATESLVKHMQVAGRVLRTFPGKADALIIDHGDNVRRHGWPTEDHPWTLADADAPAVGDYRQNGGGERKILTCGHCGAMRQGGAACPSCGHKRLRSGVKVYNEAGELRELKPRKVAELRSQDVLQKTWMQCLAIAARKGEHFYVAKAIFANKTKHKADDMKPMPPAHKMLIPVGVVYPGFLKRRKATA